MSDVEQEIIAAVRDFRNRLPRATKEQAAEEADRMFAESPYRRKFITRWEEEENAAARIRQAEFKSDFDRIWPERKGY